MTYLATHKTRCLAAALFAFLAMTSKALAQNPAPAAPTPPKTPAQSPPATWPKDASGLTALATQLTETWYAKVAAQDTDGAQQLMQQGFQNLNFQGALDCAGTLATIKTNKTTAAIVSGVIATREGEVLVVTCLVSAKETLGELTLPTAAAARLSIWSWVDGAFRMAAMGSMNMPVTRPAPGKPSFAGDDTKNLSGLALVTTFVGDQTNKSHDKYDASLSVGMQSINFKGQKGRDDLMKGARHSKSTAPAVFTDVRATTCGTLTIVSCTMTLGMSVGFAKLPADPAPFLVVFQGNGASAQVIASVNQNQPK
ncbi:hypothetical protein LBMAG49_21190 [Planctomycetota bacterium]|nr:hypothetical protein LBMAG49_21190 [Planctomycetota bacterium]